MKARIIAALLLLGIVAAACGSDDGSDPGNMGGGGMDMGDNGGMDDDGMDMGGSDEGNGGASFGEPGDPAAADREIEVLTLDSFEFDPSSIEVDKGETITFVITNDGNIRHEFLLGGDSQQREHEAEMQGMQGGMMTDEPYAVWVEPGETKELTWTFTEAGEVLYGCHEPGHYDAGMVGTITVS